MPHCKYPPVINQLGTYPPGPNPRNSLTRLPRAEYHPYVLTHLQPVLDIMEKHNIRVESYGGLSPLLRHPTGGPIKPLLEKVAARLSKETGKDVDAAMALILWQRSKGVVVVTASGNAERIKKLSLTQELPDLTKEEVDKIEAVGRKIHYRAYVRLGVVLRLLCESS